MIDKPTILFVSNFKDNQNVIATLRTKYELFICMSCSECMNILMSENIRMIVFDHQPLNEVYEMLDIRKRTKFTYTPILVLVNKLTLPEKTKLLNYNLVDFLDESINMSVFMGKIRLLNSYKANANIEEYEYITEHDPITGLYNNRGFFERSRDFVRQHSRDKLSLVIIEIEKFDLYYTYNGMDKSLILLKYVAKQITKTLSDMGDSIIGRFNPNRFAIILPYNKLKLEKALSRLQMVVGKYDENYYLLTKICINNFIGSNFELNNLCNLSALTLNNFVPTHENFIVYYSDIIKKHAIDDQELINDMQNGIENNEFQVFFQPKYVTEIGKPYGAEALVRWVHPRRGIINPGAFVPLFEANGSISRIDLYVWEQVCILLRKWLDENRNPAPVSVNMSRLDAYNIDVVEKLKSLVDKYKIPINLLQIEITESAYVKNFDTLVSTINRLKDCGFTISIDDFGTGYTSLQSLNNIPIDIIKFDKSLLLNKNERGRCIISELVKLSHDLHITTVIEGVENECQALFFKQIGCDFIQGFYYGMPMPVTEYEELTKKYEKMEYYQYNKYFK